MALAMLPQRHEACRSVEWGRSVCTENSNLDLCRFWGADTSALARERAAETKAIDIKTEAIAYQRPASR